MSDYANYNWKGYGRPDCKLTMRLNPDALTVASQQEEEFHSAVAERRLQEEGIEPALNLYLFCIGVMSR